MKKQVFLVDLGNVLVTFWERLDWMRHIIKVFGGDPNTAAELFPGSKQGVNGEDLYHAMDIGTLTSADFYEQFCRASGVNLTFERFLQISCRHIEIIPPVVDLLLEIQRRFPVIAVSNGNFVAPDLLRVHGINFLEVFVSADHGVKKPGLFAKVVAFLKEKGFEPSISPYVDDLPKYVEGVREYGMPGILFNGREESVEVLKQSLAKFGIE